MMWLINKSPGVVFAVLFCCDGPRLSVEMENNPKDMSLQFCSNLSIRIFFSLQLAVTKKQFKILCCKLRWQKNSLEFCAATCREKFQTVFFFLQIVLRLLSVIISCCRCDLSLSEGLNITSGFSGALHRPWLFRLIPDTANAKAARAVGDVTSEYRIYFGWVSQVPTQRLVDAVRRRRPPVAAA